ncbi:MAG TPA: hypothetical protein VGH13_11560 [Xanthobacteraceae bacterium]|jgi:hypothetical protein
MRSYPENTRPFPEIPDDDADFTPDLARKIIAKYHEILANPVAVHLNMLRGGIAKPSWAQIKHLYPEEFGAPAQGKPDCGAEVQQHIGWIKLYVEGMTVDNWRDMKLRAERQLEKLSDAVSLTSTNCQPLNKKTRCEACNLLEPCDDPGCPNALSSPERNSPNSGE